MSIYSGFATRHLQNIYDYLVKEIIQLLVAKLSHVFTVQPLFYDNHFKFQLSKKILRLQQLDQRKYLIPKYSELLIPFANQFGVESYFQKRKESSASSQSRKKSVFSLRSERQRLGKFQTFSGQKKSKIREIRIQRKTKENKGNKSVFVQKGRQRMNRMRLNRKILLTEVSQPTIFSLKRGQIRR